jgi:hypothetical protein
MSSFEERVKPTGHFVNTKVLARDQLVLYWNVTSKKFIAELHANTNGWVGFGFSSDGELANSDMFVGWIARKKSFHKDCFIFDNRLVEDVNNNFRLLHAKESNDLTVFKFERYLNLCDSDDRSIEVTTETTKKLNHLKN